ncbi:cell division protein CrgA [Actinotalea sp. C106]|uniref:cell division protein CrgA n=1 Tax=Actinotalea sp. C106 TaxID=2908644 RepID=UPI0020287BA9|nr:cell division protein CrgA [Actinotalea sp. C106]
MPESKSRKKPSYEPPPSGKASQANPAWLVPTMLTLLLVGLAWVVVTYISRTEFPVPGIGNWNLAIGFVFMIAGFALTTRWR